MKNAKAKISSRRVGNGIRVRTTVSDGSRTTTKTKTIRVK